MFGQRRRPMSFSVGEGEGESDYNCALRQAKILFEDVIMISSSSVFILQLKNEEWSGEFTDLKEADIIYQIDQFFVWWLKFNRYILANHLVGAWKTSDMGGKEFETTGMAQ